MKKHWLEIIFHGFFWTSTTWLITSSFSIQSHEIELENGNELVKIVRNNGLAYQLIICIVLSFFAFYVNSWLIIKSNRTVNTNSPIWYCLLTFVLLTLLIFAVTEIKLVRSTPPIPKQIAFGVAVFYYSISIAYALAKNSIFNKQRHLKLILDKKQAELNLYRNQLQPHFLFNALNNLLSMVNRTDNPKLVSSFDKLSQLLRFVIEDNKAEKISISKEIQFLKNYIELQLLRFEEDEVDVQFTVNGVNNEQKIEPGLLISFVENAFKYGTEPEKRSKIDIEFDLSERNFIRFVIKNKILMINANGTGTGIETTKKRLDLIYPDNHQLNISKADDFVVRLTICTQ